ncbi:MAG: hypothetical protein V5804_09565 [Mucilaginibacter sp.]|uniref:hypothetical protein n=1 Tax=Mucilaginibacter sp. TaxID=1882438 RepID=UPI0034E46B29
MKTLFTFLLLTFATSSFAQDTLSYKAYRSVWSIIPRIGVGDKQTRSNFATYGSIGLRREFALFKLLSLNAVAGYSSASGRYGNPNLNVLVLGGGFTIYLFSIIDKVNSVIYGKQQASAGGYENIYIDVNAEININDSKYGYAGDASGPRIEVNFGRRQLSKGLFLSPKLGFHGIVFAKPQLGVKMVNEENFFYVGAALGLNPKPKNGR